MRAIALSVAIAVAATSSVAAAQAHSAHSPESESASPSVSECEREAAAHRAMGHAVPDDACSPAGDADEPKSGGPLLPLDLSRLGQTATAMDAIPDSEPPAAAGSGPPRAADAIWGAAAMQQSREVLRKEHGAMASFWFQGDRAEYRLRNGADGYLWDVQAYYGGDLDKFWFKSEGEGNFGEAVERADAQALYSRAIDPWWDLQIGVRHDLAPFDRTYAVVGIQGLAPYMFEVDAAAFLSDRGDLTGRIEAELDQRITQTLILQPRAEIAFAAQYVPELGVGAGIDRIELGLRLRYEFAREFAPYIGIEQEWALGRSARFARLSGEDPANTNLLLGLRFWF